VSKVVVITGAAGNIGSKLRAHFATLGWTLRLLDVRAAPDVQQADLLDAEGAWTTTLTAADAVIHLGGHPSPTGTWTHSQQNIDMTANVLRAARERGARRVIFASSNWVMAGYRFAGTRLTTDLEPHPLNPYGVSKLVGERMGRDAAAQGLSFIAFRIGWNQATPGNRPSPHMRMGLWGQHMWLSDRDLCYAHERAVLAEDVRFAVLNLMSDNPGMPWDIDQTRQTIGYAPQDGWTAMLDEDARRREDLVRRSRALSADLEAEVMQSGW
jgi:NAD+ dependent glucose-6-phosphate dehydrogenase